MTDRTKMYDLPLVYVAGPYTNPDPICNTRTAIEWGDRINETGVGTAYVPHVSMVWHLVKAHDDVEYWYEYDLALLARCDILFRFPGASSGADAEVEFANERGIPVFTNWNDAFGWLIAASDERHAIHP